MSTHVNRSVFASTEPNDCQLTPTGRGSGRGPVGRCWKNSSVSLCWLLLTLQRQQRFGSAAVQLQLGRQCRHGDERGRSTFAGECRAQNSVCLARAAPMGALLAGHCSWSRPRRPRKCRSPLYQRLPSGCLVHQHRCSFSCRSFSQNPCQCAVDEPRAKRSVLRRAPSALARKVAAAKH
jgi:hypothetical protein